MARQRPRTAENVIERAVIVTKGSVLNVPGHDLRLSNGTPIPLALDAAVNHPAGPNGGLGSIRTILDDT